ncbi:Rieske 2Fe-2S domain-containing protein [Pontibacter sp. E15-1]|uniref:Rieske (2Fe-2S) protein n=1 Tax=Pontibacter sp. E15-1 TaxID=2919918 RepID=UPI001F4F6829|nr:Rieske 2Fe-2S domain-containing protein [Pontibacter sp. E15-1]MCJ8167249.1 Rieske 2Fe-2S domain-containing protein [Pontibacter sp. E15-1]
MAASPALYTWHKIFSSEQEAKAQVALRQLLRLEVDGRTICLAHTAKGFFALDDACPHLGHSLSRGTTNYLNEVICPWHSYRFDLESGRECEYRTRNAVQHPIEFRDDGMYIGIRQQSLPAG